MSRTTHGPEEEGQLVQRCLDHDATAQAELWARYYGLILDTVRGFLVFFRAPPDLDEDIAAIFWSDLFVYKPWRLRAYCPAQGSLEAYLKAVARLAVLDFLAAERRRKPVTHPLPEGDLPACLVADAEVQEVLEYVLAHLSPDERTLLLSYLHGDAGVDNGHSAGPEGKRAAARDRQRKKGCSIGSCRSLSYVPGARKLEEKVRTGVTKWP